MCLVCKYICKYLELVNKKILIILETCSLFTPLIYQLKIKCKDGGSYFQKYQKYRQLEIEKYFFQLFYFKNF